MTVSLIWAMSQNRVIGRNNALPWKLPDEYRYFLDRVRGNTVIMGRKTFESIGHPLRHCRNIVVSRTTNEFDGAEHTESFVDALHLASVGFEETRSKEIFAIGGASIYQEALQVADRLYCTIIESEIEGDVLFPEYDRSSWQCKQISRHEIDSRHQFSFVTYVCKRIRSEASLVTVP